MRARLTTHLSLILISFVATSCGSKVLKNAEQLLELGQCDQARPILEKFVQESPRNSDAFVLLGDTRLCLAEKGGGREGLRSALEAYESAYKLESSSAVAALHLGLARLVSSDMAGALQTLREGLKHNPKDVALRAYLSIVLWHAGDPDLNEVGELIKHLSLDEGWYQFPTYKLRDSRARGIFIVTKDKASLRRVQGGDGGILPQWEVMSYSEEKGDSLRFSDTIHPETEVQFGYVDSRQAFSEYGCPGPGQIVRPKTEVIDKDWHGSLVGRVGQGQMLWAKSDTAANIYSYTCHVQYGWQVYPDKFIRRADVVIGVGEEVVDRARAEVFAKVSGKLDSRLLTHLFNGELRPRLPYVLVNAVLGQTLPPLSFKEGMLSLKKVSSTVEVSGLTLTYENGLLASWKGEWRSGAEDQDYDSQ